MGLQLVFVVETNKKCISDWIYIKDTIDCIYRYDQAQTKFSPVYMDGKGKYKSKEKEISNLVSQYASTSKTNETKIIYCFDCDDYDINQEDSLFLKNARQYCLTKGYQFIWFCKDIERVYLGKQVDDSNKQNESVTFKKKKLIAHVDIERLSFSDYRLNTSNIINVLDMYLTRKP